jgi:hypothetical protein
VFKGQCGWYFSVIQAKTKIPIWSASIFLDKTVSAPAKPVGPTPILHYITNVADKK